MVYSLFYRLILGERSGCWTIYRAVRQTERAHLLHCSPGQTRPIFRAAVPGNQRRRRRIWESVAGKRQRRRRGTRSTLSQRRVCTGGRWMTTPSPPPSLEFTFCHVIFRFLSGIKTISWTRSILDRDFSCGFSFSGAVIKVRVVVCFFSLCFCKSGQFFFHVLPEHGVLYNFHNSMGRNGMPPPLWWDEFVARNCFLVSRDVTLGLGEKRTSIPWQADWWKSSRKMRLLLAKTNVVCIIARAIRFSRRNVNHERPIRYSLLGIIYHFSSESKNRAKCPTNGTRTAND